VWCCVVLCLPWGGGILTQQELELQLVVGSLQCVPLNGLLVWLTGDVFRGEPFGAVALVWTDLIVCGTGMWLGCVLCNWTYSVIPWLAGGL
jgi:hypothetical protein